MSTTKKKPKVAKTANEIHRELAAERLHSSDQFIVITMKGEDIQITKHATMFNEAALVTSALAMITDRFMRGSADL